MKVAVAMSGGIDSSVAAVLLKEQGHDVIGITARFIPGNSVNDVVFENALKDAVDTANKLSIQHHVFDFSEQFTRDVIKPFCAEYINGKTPNPCIVCNHMVKFRLLLDEAEKLGCSLLATGHYAVIRHYDERYCVSMGTDRSRDQSYFLCRLTQDQLQRIIFPLGELTKASIREIARERGLIIHDKPDSQEICFIPDNDYISFIESNIGIKPESGYITDSSGKILGTHSGIHRYTIGQRRGMGISGPVPLYVTGIDAVNNRIIAGTREDLYVSAIETSDCYNMKYIITQPVNALIKSRSTQIPVSGTVKRNGDTFTVIFDTPQTGISPGQTAVFYDELGDIIGCGKIAFSRGHG